MQVKGAVYLTKLEPIKIDDEEINDKWLIVTRKLKQGMKLEDIPEAKGMSKDWKVEKE